MLGASLVVYHEDLEPSRISARLGLEPTLAFRRGEAIVTRSGRYSDHRTGGWVVNSRDVVASDELEAHIAWILDRVEPAFEAIQSLKAEGNDVALICVFSGGDTGGGPTLSPATLARIAKLEIPVDFDVYC